MSSLPPSLARTRRLLSHHTPTPPSTTASLLAPGLPRPYLYSPRRQFGQFFSRRKAPQPRSMSNEEIIALAKRHQHPLSLADLVKHGRPPLSEESLLSSANFTLSLLPIRLANRIQALRNLPFIIVSNPNISKIHDNYVQSLSTLLPWLECADAESARQSASHPRPELAPPAPYPSRTIKTLEDEVRFTNALSEQVATHRDTIPILAKGFLECRRYIPADDVTRFLDEHLRARIGTRLIAEQHIALHCSSQPHSGTGSSAPAASSSPDASTYIGVIDTALRPATVVEACADMVAEICELRYGVRPRLVIDGEPDTTFAFIPMHLEYIITELLKNAFRATVENQMTHEPIVVTIAAEPPKAATPASALFPDTPVPVASDLIQPLDDTAPGVTIRIRDRGGGISPDVLPHIWSYSYTTFSEMDDVGSGKDGIYHSSGIEGLLAISNLGAGGSSIAGLGYGLPLSQAYAQYFGGGIAVQSLFGWGTDVYLRLKGVGRIK